jgi:ATP phosphoribosyltransferase
VKAPSLVDAIVEGTETGSSLRANSLRIVDTVAESTTKLIANHAAWDDEWKRKKIESIALLLKGALQAGGRVGLKMNVPKYLLDDVTAKLPALHTPTISYQMDPEWVAVEIITEEWVVRDLVPELKQAGATGIIEYPLNKVIY